MRRIALALPVVLWFSVGGSAEAALSLTKHALLPAAHLPGATGTFRTDVTIFNPEGTKRVHVVLRFTRADQDGTDSPGFALDPDLEPRETVTLADVLGPDYLNAGNTYGLLEVESSERVIVTSNTYNVAGAQAGTYGQFSPGQPEEDAIGYDDSFNGDVYTPGLRFDANHRVNAAIVNPTGVPLEAAVQLVDKAGFIYQTNFYKLKPYSLHQINDVFRGDFADRRLVNDDSYRLNFFVNLGNGAKVLSYATVTDVRTGDPYLIPGQSLK